MVMPARLVATAVLAVALLPLSGCGGDTAATPSSPSRGSSRATGITPGGLMTFSMLGVQFQALPRFTAGAPDHHVDGSTTLTYTAPGGQAGLDPQIGLGVAPHQQQDADGATSLALEVFKYTNEKITSNTTVQVPGARGHGRLVDLTYVVKDTSGQQHLTRLQTLRFVGADGTGYEVFVRATAADFGTYRLGQVLDAVRLEAAAT